MEAIIKKIRELKAQKQAEITESFLRSRTKHEQENIQGSFACLDCGRRFRSLQSAQKAAWNGCPRCGSEEIRKLLNVSPPYLKNIIKGALFTGLRKGDLLNLRWSNVDLERGILFFNEEKKRGAQRIKCLGNDMIDLLMRIPKRESDHIFTGPDGKPLKDVQRSFRTALKKAGISDFHFHDLRHTSASYMVMKGASMKGVQEHLGHTSLTMTGKYSHLNPEFQKAEVERLSGLCDEKPDDKKLIRNDQFPESEFKTEVDATA